MTAAGDPRDLLATVDRARMRAERRARLDAALDAFGVDAVVAFEYANSRYVSDLRPLWAPNFLVRQAAIAVRGVDRAIVFVHQDDTPHRRSIMDWLAPMDVREFPTGVANFGGGDAFRPLVVALDELGAPERAVVATDIGTVASIQNLTAALGPRRLVDANPLMAEVRAHKSDDELQLMRFASVVSDLAMARAIASVAPGVRECEVLAEAMGVLYRYGAEVPQCNLIVCSGPNTMPMQRYAGERAIESGDLVMLDIGACFSGMFSELARTTVCEEPNDDQRAIFRVAVDILEATVAAMSSSSSLRDLQVAAAGPYEASPYRGLMQRMIVAHGIGVGYAEGPFVPPPGGAAASASPIGSNVTLAVVPTLLVPGIPGGGGVRVEDVVAITDNGVERLTKHPFDPKLLG